MTRKEKRTAARWIWGRRRAWNGTFKTVSGLYYELLNDIRWHFWWKPFERKVK